MYTYLLLEGCNVSIIFGDTDGDISQDKDAGLIRKEEEEDLRSENLSQLDDDCAENLGSVPGVVTGRGTKTAPEAIKKKAKSQK